MSLQVWLPLNGDTNNLGIADFQPAAADIEYTEFGKIGNKCLSGGTISMTASQTASIFNNNEITIAFWIKTEESSSSATIFGNADFNTVNNNRKFSIWQWPTAQDLHWSWMNDAASNAGVFASDTIYNGLPAETWVHVCFAYKNSALKVYLNGEIKKTQSEVVSNSASFFYDTILLHSSNLRCINDLRVYDHCLSSNEIKILSQGLIAHYKLEGLKLTNMIPSMESAFGASSIEYTKYSPKTLKLTGIINSPEITKTSNTSATLTNGHIYYARYETYQENAVGGSEFFWPVIGGYSFSKTSTANTWNIVSSVFTRNYTSGTYNYRLDFNNNNNAGNMWFDGTILIDLTTEFGAGNEPSKEWCDVNIPYFTGTLEFTNTTDSSGYCNDGIASAPFTFSPDTKHYKTSTIFKDNKYINCGRGAMVTDALTVNWWGQMSDWSLYASTPMRALSCTDTGGWNFEPNSGKMCFAMGTGSTSNSYKNAVGTTTFNSMVNNSWHMFTGTYDGFTTKLYVDGKLEGENKAYSVQTPIFYNKTNNIYIGVEAGDKDSLENVYFTGKISDVRIYATALTEQDVQRLYNTPISLSNDGTLNALEYIETSLSKFTKTGLIVADTIRDCNATGDTQATKLQIFKNATQATDFIEW